MKPKGHGRRILVIGELNIDVVASGLREAPQLGEEILASDFALTLGSASAIFACGIAKLGYEVTFVSKVGADEFGKFCLSELRAAGVSTSHVIRKKELQTGVTIALSTNKERALVTYPGSISAVGPDLFRSSLLRGHQHLHMTSYFLQTRLKSSFPRIFREAQEMGLSTSFDPNSDPSQNWDREIDGVLAHTDLLFLNENEALRLTRQRDVRSALKKLGDLVPCVVIKRGARGAIGISEGKTTSVPAFRIVTKDTTGAGDSFAAGFVSSFLRGGSIRENLRSGNACGALSAMYAGGTAGQPDLSALNRFLKEH